jgi:hypothetical protein
MCVLRTRCVSTIVCAKQWIASMLPLRLNTEYFIKYGNIILEKPKDGRKYGECQLDDVWRWVCRDQVNGHGSCKSHYSSVQLNVNYCHFFFDKGLC